MEKANICIYDSRNLKKLFRVPSNEVKKGMRSVTESAWQLHKPQERVSRVLYIYI